VTCLSSLMNRSSTSRTKGIDDRGTRKLPLFWIAVLSGMGSLLIMVAVLQYRWTKQLSVATEARIGSTLQPLMMRWHLDFYGELSALCVALQVGPDSGARDNWNDYLRRYVDLSHAPMSHESVENIYANPGLIENIYIWDSSDSRLLRLNADTAKIEISAYPKIYNLYLLVCKQNRQVFPLLCALGNSRTHQQKNAPEATMGSHPQLHSEPINRLDGSLIRTFRRSFTHCGPRSPFAVARHTACKRPKSSRLGRNYPQS